MLKKRNMAVHQALLGMCVYGFTIFSQQLEQKLPSRTESKSDNLHKIRRWNKIPARVAEYRPPASSTPPVTASLLKKSDIAKKHNLL